MAGDVVRDERTRGHRGGEGELLRTLLRDSRRRNRAHIICDRRVGRDMGAGRLLVIHHEPLVPVASIDDRRSAHVRPTDDRR